MSINIAAIGSYIPDAVDCRTKLERHGVEESFIKKKTGFVGNSRMLESESTSDMCVKAFFALEEKYGSLADKVDFVCVCTQNGDNLLPQVSAEVHGKLGLNQNCAAFDISLGCSGYVYGLSVVKSFMESNGLQCGVLFTADPYSGIIDENDKNTDLLFGDAATATLITEDGDFRIGKFVFDTMGAKSDHLVCPHGGRLHMDGRGIFDFVLRYVPVSIKKCLTLNKYEQEQIDYYVLHQASKFLLQNIARRLKVAVAKVPFVAAEYGNTVSSSVPLALEETLERDDANIIVVSGFGVGLSMATATIERLK